jgi:multidrug efflux pump subunit AcrB
MSAQLNQLPGCDFNFSQVIEDNVEEALSGVKGELAIKLFGDDLKILAEKGDEIRKVLEQVRGVKDPSVEQLSGQPNLTIKVDRDAMASAEKLPAASSKVRKDLTYLSDWFHPRANKSAGLKDFGSIRPPASASRWRNWRM